MTTNQAVRSEMAADETESARQDIVITQHGAAVCMTLNRPKALNALNDAMRARIAEVLPGYMRNPEVYAVVLQSASDRAFCAGGDVRELSALAHRDLALARKSLADEYRLNWQLDCFSKPTVSLMDGMCVGSGVGLTLYNTHRVAGENYSFAMPETGIGLFPDLGVCKALAALPDNVGIYLGLTGRSIGRADAYTLGLVTHCISAGWFPEIISALADAEPVDPLLDGRHSDPGLPYLDTYRGVINRVFSGATVEEIIDNLTERAGSTDQAAPFCQAILDELAARSPTSLKITLRHLHESRGRGLRETLEWDHCLAGRCMAAPDFHEGVRAILIDKDRTPSWQPATLAAVSDHMVNKYFQKFGADDLELKLREQMQQ
jgi:enoyl-CoA hydratase/carnithine racemase